MMFSEWFQRSTRLSGENDYGTDLVERATNELLIAPDWEANLAVCDYLNNQCHSENECMHVVKALKTKITESSLPSVRLFALVLLDTCIKNCKSPFINAISNLDFMRALEEQALSVPSNESKWIEVREKILEIIQCLGQTFETEEPRYSNFHETYSRLTARGCIFPFQSTTSIHHNISTKSNDPYAKIKRDLSIVRAKVKSLEKFRQTEFDPTKYEAIYEFLVQCKPRLELLIQVGSEGALSDYLLSLSMDLNDAIYHVLDRDNNLPHKSSMQQAKTIAVKLAPPKLARPRETTKHQESISHATKDGTLQCEPISELLQVEKNSTVQKPDTKLYLRSNKAFSDSEEDEDEQSNLINRNDDEVGSDENARLLP